MNSKPNNSRSSITTALWQFPWKYKESFILVFSAVIIGFIIEFFTNTPVASLSFPDNVIFLTRYIFIILSIHFFLRKTIAYTWLKSPYLAIASIIAVLLLVILMGSFTQDMPSSRSWVNTFGLNRIAFSYPFVMVLAFFLTNIALVTLSRLIDLTLRNILFATNHLGIFITSIALIFSVGDIQKHTVKVETNNYLYTVENNNRIEELPFALRLVDFNIEFFAPKIAIVDNASDEVISGNGFLISLDTDSVLKYKGYEISKEEFLPKSVRQGDRYYFVNDVGFAPSALLKIVAPDKSISHQWVSCGSFVYPSDYISLDSNYTVVMLEPESKVFQSKIQVLYPNEDKELIDLKVNQPVTLESWDIYQTDYDKKSGVWSDYSIIEMVKDPWLPVIYIGIGMLIFGALLLMFVGQTEAKKDGNL